MYCNSIIFFTTNISMFSFCMCMPAAENINAERKKNMPRVHFPVLKMTMRPRLNS